VSYLFIAIVCINHHYLMRYATDATTRRCGSISRGGLLLGGRNDDDSEQSGHHPRQAAH
jgi:hypothetical protein